MIGIAIFMGNSGSLGAVYAGRFIAGLGVGQTVVVAPVYLAEIVSNSCIQRLHAQLTHEIRPPLPFVVFALVSLLALSIWALCWHTLRTMAVN